MLNARERQPLHEIRHPFPAEPFPGEQGRSPHDHDRPMYTTAVLVTTALFVLMLVGPNVLTEKEIRARMTSSPRRSRATPDSLPELTDLDHLPWAHAHALSVLSSARSRPPLRHTSSVAA